eukprot:9107579-Alexandrium_andersonii.AAC.1
MAADDGKKTPEGNLVESACGEEDASRSVAEVAAPKASQSELLGAPPAGSKKGPEVPEEKE